LWAGERRHLQLRYNRFKGTRIPLNEFEFEHILGYKWDDKIVADLVLNFKSSRELQKMDHLFGASYSLFYNKIYIYCCCCCKVVYTMFYLSDIVNNLAIIIQNLEFRFSFILNKLDIVYL